MQFSPHDVCSPQDGATVLMKAAARGHVELVTKLAEMGAHVAAANKVSLISTRLY